jgi:hypothetical protein
VIQIDQYTPDARDEWDDFVAAAKNGSFLFHRQYMEYHADRFIDYSRLVRSDGKLIALLPANRIEDTVTSHSGLTYGGLVLDRRATVQRVLDIFDALTTHLREDGVARFVYKAIPHIYHTVPAEEDLYALFRSGAVLVRRDVAASVRMADRLPLAKGRKSALGVARRNGVTVARSDDFATFMEIEAALLAEKYGVEPVHSAEEITMLAGRFPDQIKLFAAYRDTEMLGGVIIYETAQVAHAQYIASTEAGRSMCALDMVMEHLLGVEYAEKRYFDFGISTERAGRVLNNGLAAYKESYGGRAIVYDHYVLEIAR